jgi:hypothetical protein
MPILKSKTIVLGAIGIVAVLITLGYVTPVLTGNAKVTQTETYQLHTFDKKEYFPAEAIVTVTAPKTMYVAEGWDYVDIKVELVKHENVSGFMMTKIECYLGTMNNFKFTISEMNFHVFGENGNTFQTILELDPKEGLHDARIQIAMGIELFYEDGHSIYLGGFTTQPVFGLYEVQDRFHLLMYSTIAVFIGTAVIFILVRRRTNSPS